MTLEEFKQAIELNTLDVKYIIVVCEDESANFVFHQYLRAYTKQRNININFVDAINSKAHIDLFNQLQNTFDVYVCTKLDIDVIPRNTTWVRCKSVSKQVEKSLSDYIVRIKKLEPWQIRDYVYTLCAGIDQRELDILLDTYKDNIYGLDNEISKLLIFNDMNKVYPKIKSQLFNDVSSFGIFDLVNALIKCDIILLKNILPNIDNIDVDIFGLLKLLQLNFKRVIDVQLSKNATAESLGMSGKQFYAIKKFSTNIYTRNQLLSIYEFITSCDYYIKSGYIDTENMLDYIITKIISVKKR